jgi:hypothetical protein
MGRFQLYMLIKEGHIEAVEVGSMTLMPMRSPEQLMRPEGADLPVLSISRPQQ